jgi:hypothetical protein
MDNVQNVIFILMYHRHKPLDHISKQFSSPHFDIFISNQAMQEACPEKKSRINSSSQWRFPVEVDYVSEEYSVSFLSVEKCPEAGDITFLRIVCNILPEYIQSYLRRE